MDPAPTAGPRRSPAPVAVLLAVAGAAYTGVALVPWLRGTLVGPYGGNGFAVLGAVALLSAALVALAVGGTALVTRRSHRRTWAALVLVAVGALAWLLTPAATALLVTALD